MSALFFYFFAALTILSALMVVLNRDAVNSAMFMILTLSSVAALFVLLHAYFLAALQIVVYAGAVMVLFLFIIMLLDTQGRHRPRFSVVNLVAAMAALALLSAGASWLAYQFHAGVKTPAVVPVVQEMPAEGNPLGYASDAKAYGFGLFTRYMLPFQVTGFLLLIAMVGIIVLSKRSSPPPPDNPANDAADNP